MKDTFLRSIYRPFFLPPTILNASLFFWKIVSVSVRYLFYQPMDEKIFFFPAKEIPTGEGIVQFANRVAVWRQREVSMDF